MPAGGTSATRAIAQQLPLLASGLRLWGVAIGTAAAVVAAIPVTAAAAVVAIPVTAAVAIPVTGQRFTARKSSTNFYDGIQFNAVFGTRWKDLPRDAQGRVLRGRMEGGE